MNGEKPANHLVERALNTLKREYVVVGKTHIRAWHAWLIFGIVAGAAAGVLFVANRGGEFEATKAAQLIQQQTVLTDLRNLYSSSVLDYKGIKRMWTGGWLTEADVGPDKIYYSELVNGLWTRPILAFAKPGFHVNDPTIIKHPQQDWLFMYYTALNNNLVASGQIFSNVIGFASSVDGGKIWTDHGIVIGDPNVAGGGSNSIDNFGAWSPSAIVRGNEIWVYYNTNASNPNVFRTKFNLSGWQKVGSAQSIAFLKQGQVCAPNVNPLFCAICSLFSNCPAGTFVEGFGHDDSQNRVNVDVSWQDPWLVMLVNDLNSNSISRYIGTDGINWITHPQDVNPIINGGLNFVTTPHAETINWNRYRVYFGLSTTDNSHFDSIHAWEFKSF